MTRFMRSQQYITQHTKPFHSRLEFDSVFSCFQIIDYAGISRYSSFGMTSSTERGFATKLHM